MEDHGRSRTCLEMASYNSPEKEKDGLNMVHVDTT